jgi:hypothetical protein
MEIINWKLISHPLNWVVLFLMIFIFLAGLNLVLRYQQAQKQTPAS